MGIVIVEQFAEVALSLADAVLVMRLGKVAFSGSAEHLRSTPMRCTPPISTAPNTLRART